MPSAGFTGTFDPAPDQFRRLLDRRSDHLASHCLQAPCQRQRARLQQRPARPPARHGVPASWGGPCSRQARHGAHCVPPPAGAVGGGGVRACGAARSEPAGEVRTFPTLVPPLPLAVGEGARDHLLASLLQLITEPARLAVRFSGWRLLAAEPQTPTLPKWCARCRLSDSMRGFPIVSNLAIDPTPSRGSCAH